MSTEPGHAEIDALLAELPQWTPSPDFAARLAAAAARQAARPSRPPMSTHAWLTRRLVRRLPLILGAAVLALALATAPWATLTLNPLFPWIFSIGSASLGGWMTMRLIRT